MRILLSNIKLFTGTVLGETVVCLSHQQIDKYKTVDYTPDGSYMDNINKHATYKEINEYVLAVLGSILPI